MGVRSLWRDPWKEAAGYYDESFDRDVRSLTSPAPSLGDLSEHGDSGEESSDGNDSADETGSEGTDDGGEELTESEKGYASNYQPIKRLQCHFCRGVVRVSSSRCTDCRLLNYGCPDTGLCIDPVAYDWLS